MQTFAVSPFDLWAVLKSAMLNVLRRATGGLIGLIGGVLLGVLSAFLIEMITGVRLPSVVIIAAAVGLIVGFAFPRAARILVEILWMLVSLPLP